MTREALCQDELRRLLGNKSCGNLTGKQSESDSTCHGGQHDQAGEKHHWGPAESPFMLPAAVWAAVLVHTLQIAQPRSVAGARVWH